MRCKLILYSENVWKSKKLNNKNINQNTTIREFFNVAISACERKSKKQMISKKTSFKKQIKETILFQLEKINRTEINVIRGHYK
jgi:hypothetical protein